MKTIFFGLIMSLTLGAAQKGYAIACNQFFGFHNPVYLTTKNPLSLDIGKHGSFQIKRRGEVLGEIYMNLISNIKTAALQLGTLELKEILHPKEVTKQTYQKLFNRYENIDRIQILMTNDNSVDFFNYRNFILNGLALRPLLLNQFIKTQDPKLIEKRRREFSSTKGRPQSLGFLGKQLLKKLSPELLDIIHNEAIRNMTITEVIRSQDRSVSIVSVEKIIDTTLIQLGLN